MPRTIVTEMDRSQFKTLVEAAPGLVVVSFTADWCSPCVSVHDHVEQHMSKLPESCVCAELDVDVNFDLYASLRAGKQVRGIPVLLAFTSESSKYSLHSISGADHSDIDAFFADVAGSHNGLVSASGVSLHPS